ncbi:MAG: GNAT family N-acetyltransferase [Caldilineaceae bacterium]
MNQSIVWLDQLEAQNLYLNGNGSTNGDRAFSLKGKGPTVAAGFVVTATAIKEARRIGAVSESLQEEILRFYHQLIVNDGTYKPFVHISVAPVRQGVVEVGESELVFGSESVLHTIKNLVVAEAGDSSFSVLVQSYQTPLQLRTYTAIDQDACLAIFDSNRPRFFAAEDRAEFENFLNEPRCDYFVIEAKGEIVGCGGFWLDKEHGRAGLVWGMVHNNHHRQGIGRYLLLARLQTIGLQVADTTVLLNTSQQPVGFYARFGFEVQKITENGYGPGLDCYNMALRLDQPKRRWVAEQLR